MTLAAASALVQKLLEREGGVADVGDGKGTTHYGQTLGWLSQFNLPVPQDAEHAATNYLAWLHLTGLNVAVGDEADPFADFLIDFAVHSGHQAAIRALQRVLKVPVDGVLGPVTIAALNGADRLWLAFAILAAENRYQGQVITNNPQRSAYAHGWANRQADKLMQLAPPRN